VIHKVVDDYRKAALAVIKEKWARDLTMMADEKRRSLQTIRP